MLQDQKRTQTFSPKTTLKEIHNNNESNVFSEKSRTVTARVSSVKGCKAASTESLRSVSEMQNSMQTQRKGKISLATWIMPYWLYLYFKKLPLVEVIS